MKVDIIFQRTSDPDVFIVLRTGIRIGKVMNYGGSVGCIFKHDLIDDLLFVGDTREDAVSIYYKNFGGTNYGRMDCFRFSEQCKVSRSGW